MSKFRTIVVIIHHYIALVDEALGVSGSCTTIISRSEVHFTQASPATKATR